MSFARSGAFAGEGRLIIGASAAGVSALRAMLKANAQAGVTMITQETSPPYCPTALHHLLSGRMVPESIKLLEEKELKEARIELLTGTCVVSVDPTRHQILAEGGEVLPYTKLLIATGVEPILPAIPGLDSEAVFTFRTMADNQRLLPMARPGERVATLGGGLIGLQVALALMDRGVRVTVVERETHLLPLHFDEEAASIVETAFREKGLEVFKNSTLRAVQREQGGLTLTLSSGEVLQGFAALVVAVGMKPRVGFLSGSGVDIDEGVLVDEYMRTSAEDIFAAGDVAQAPDFFTGAKRLLPILSDAAEQGRVAGLGMVGLPRPYEGGLLRRAFNFFNGTAFAIGETIAGEGLEFHIRKNLSRGRYRKLCFREGVLVGAVTVNEEDSFGVIHQLIRSRLDLSGVKKELLARPISQALLLRLRPKPRESLFALPSQE